MNSADIPINSSQPMTPLSNKTDNINNYQTYFKDYKWYNSCNLSLEISLQILRLEIPADRNISTLELSKTDIYITSYIICNSIILHESPISTLFANIDISTNSLVWDYLLNFPCKIRDLSLDSKLVLIVWTSEGVIFGSSSMSLFNEKQLFKQGKQKLMFYYHNDNNIKTLFDYQEICKGENYQYYERHDYPFIIEKKIELFTKNQNYMHKNNIINKYEWLDRYTLSYMTSTLAQSSTTSHAFHTHNYQDDDVGDDDHNIDNNSIDNINNQKSTQTYKNEQKLTHIIDKPRSYLPIVNDLETFTFLVIELPILQYPILFDEKHYQNAAIPHIPPLANIVSV